VNSWRTCSAAAAAAGTSCRTKFVTLTIIAAFPLSHHLHHFALLLLLLLHAGSVQSLTPGVTVTSVDEAEGTIQVTIPDRQIWAADAVFPDADVQLSYTPVDATGQIGAQVFVAGFGTRELHKLQTGCYESACCSCK
jgi:hypothetical protein